MQLLNALKWPLTIVVSLALIIVGVVLIGGTPLGIPESTQVAVLEWVAGIGSVLAAPLALLLSWLAKDRNMNGIPDDQEKPPPGTAVMLIAVCLGGAAALSAQGCDGARGALSGTATTIVETEAARQAFYNSEHTRCLDVGDEAGGGEQGLAAYRVCMEDSRQMAIVVDGLRRDLLLADAALEQGDDLRWQELVPCLAARAGQVIVIYQEHGVPVPDGLSDIARLASGVECTLTSGGEAE